MTPEDRDYWFGRIVSFYPDPGMVKDAVVQPHARRIAGTVVGCLDKPPAEPGGIKDFALSVRGRSGKHVTISVVNNHAKRHADFEEADAEP